MECARYTWLLGTMADHCGLSYAQRDRKLVLLCLRASVTNVDGYVGRAHALSHHAHPASLPMIPIDTSTFTITIIL